jgi:outer membrane protein assembly factor BamB
MKNKLLQILLLSIYILLIGNICAFGQDWPQWRGSNRDAKVTGFTAPQNWPKEQLTKKWNVTVGEGTDSTPALVGDKLYVFTRKSGNEVILCFDAGTGKELWKDEYAVPAVSGADQGHPGPRSSPTVADGKIYTLGVSGILSCIDTETHKVIWRKDDYPGSLPRFHTAMSPIVVDKLCIGHFGNADNGAVVAYDTATGEPKWKWTGGTGNGPSYSSPVVAAIAGTKQIIIQTEKNVVSLALADGKLLWQEAASGGRYAASSPVVDETNAVVFGMKGNGCYALKITKDGDSFKTQQLWSNEQIGAEYNTPILKNDLLFGLTPRNDYYCINAKTGTTAWSVSANSSPTARLENSPNLVTAAIAGYNKNTLITPAGFDGGRGGGMGGRGGGMGGQGGIMGRGGGMGGGVGYGSVVDAGSVLFGLTSNAKLVIFEPGDKEYKEIASYKVSDGQTYAYPIVSGNRIFISDQTSVTLWTIE